jgi:hypothetical protein
LEFRPILFRVLFWLFTPGLRRRRWRLVLFRSITVSAFFSDGISVLGIKSGSVLTTVGSLEDVTVGFEVFSLTIGTTKMDGDVVLASPGGFRVEMGCAVGLETGRKVGKLVAEPPSSFWGRGSLSWTGGFDGF